MQKLSIFSRNELLALGFKSVGKNVLVSRDARLFCIDGQLGENVRIDTLAVLTGKIVLGNDTHVSPFCFLGGTGGGIELADGSGLSTHVSVFTKSADYTSEDLSGSAKVQGAVHIGRHSIVGSGSKIMPGVTIQDNVSIGCHCVISENIPAGAVIISRGMGLVHLSQRKSAAVNT